MKAVKIIELIREYEKFENSHNGDDLYSFGLWLARKNFETPENNAEDSTELDRAINYLLGRYNRYSRHYVKKSFKDLPVKTVDECWILNYVYLNNNPSKSETYEATLTDLSLGTKIVKRLIAYGLIQEYDDPEDKRTKRLTITEKGKVLRNEVIKRLGIDSVFKLSILSNEQKQNLLSTLQDLELYHNNIYLNDK